MQQPSPEKSVSPRTAALESQHTVTLPDGSQPVALGSGTVRGILGMGGMSHVYEIWNTQLEVARAVKLLKPNCSDEIKQRFQTEMKISAKLHHPNIVEIHGVGEWNGISYIEMEKIDGPTLAALIEVRGAMPVEVCSAIGIMIARALDFAHNQEYMLYGRQYHGIIHRDLKPSNIMACSNGHLKLMDFGIARPTDVSIHTTDGVVLGTMQYLAPEQIQGEEVDQRSDLYSLGATLYEALTGIQAFAERNMSRLLVNKMRNDFRSLDSFKIKIPARLKWCIQKCLALEKEKRITHARQLLSELEKVHADLTEESPETVMRRFLASTPGPKTKIVTRRLVPWIPFFVVGSLAVGIVTLAPSARKYIQIHQRQWLEIIHTLQHPPVSPAISSINQAQDSTRVAMVDSTGAAAETTATADTTKMFKQTAGVPLADDQIRLLNDLVLRGEYAGVTQLYERLPPQIAAKPRAVIYYVRALEALHEELRLAQFVPTYDIHDGEYYLARAQVAYRGGEIDRALELLDTTLQVPSELLSQEKLKLKVYLNRQPIRMPLTHGGSYAMSCGLFPITPTMQPRAARLNESVKGFRRA
jgi:serine/threonine protein kinase